MVDIYYVTVSGTDTPLWDLVPAGIGAVIGAVASAVPTFILARRAASDVLRRDAAARVENERAAAFKAMVTLVGLVNSSGSLRKQVEQGIELADAAGLADAALWQKLIPMSGVVGHPLRFDVDSLTLVFRAKEELLANELMLLADRHASNESALVEYSKRRRALGDSIGATMSGNIGTSLLTGEQMAQVAPIMVELEAAAIQLRASLNEDADKALDLMKQFSSAMQRYFKEPTSFRFEIEGDTVSQDASVDSE